MKTHPSPVRTALLAAMSLSMFATTPAEAGPGQALYLDGTNYITVPDNDWLTFTNGFTWEAWVDITKTNWLPNGPNYEEWATIIAKDRFTAEDWFSIFSNGLFDIRFDSQAFAQPPQDSLAAVTLKTWQHVAVTWDGANVCSYVNGAPKQTNAFSGSIANTAAPLVIGRDMQQGYHFVGYMDELRLWNVARNQSQIASNMNRSLSGSESGLVAYWRFDNATTNSATLTGSSCNGTAYTTAVFAPSGALFVPDAATAAASGLGQTNATLNGTVNPGNLPTTAWFQWGADTNYGNLTAATNLAATNASLAVSAALLNLSPGQTCHFCLVATNSAGEAFGGDMVLTTRNGIDTVTTLADSGPGSLRQTIASSMAGDTILFATNGSIILTSGEIEITNNLTITGPGATNLALSGNNTSRVFDISNPSATVTISSLTISNGNGGNGANGGYGGPGDPGGNGGGVYNAGSLTLNTCTFSDNTGGSGGASGDSGLVGTTGGNGGNGGGVYSTGSLTLNTCTFSDNTGGSGGAGGIYGFNGTPGGNGGNGGGVYSTGSLSLNNCIFTDNTGGSGGTGGLGYMTDSGPGGNGGYGGGVYNAGSLALHTCTFSANTGGTGGTGGIGRAGVPCGPGGIGGNGGGIYNAGSLSLNSCTFSANTGGSGGTGGNGDSADGNQGGNGGTGGTGGTGGFGGGVYSTGSLALTACTFSANIGGSGGAGGNGGDGASGTGNGFNAGAGGIGGNGGNGGGVYSTADPTNTTLRNGLLALNSAGAGGAGGAGGNGGMFGTLSGVSGVAGSDPDLSGAFTSLGHNLLGLTGGSTGLISGVNSDLVGTMAAPINPLLGPLTNNGGPTFTLALLPGSPAIDAGDDTLTGTDQRGFPRQSGGQVDIGAFELQGSAFQPPSVAPATCVVSNVGSGLFGGSFSTVVNPNGLNTTVCLEYGITANSGATTPSVSAGYGANATNVSLMLTGLAPGTTYQYQIVATSPAGTTIGPDQTFTTGPAGDLTGAGKVSASGYDTVLANYLSGGGAISASEYGTVLSNYLAHSPWLTLTNVAGLGGTNVTFAMTNDLTGSFTVQYSTNLTDWTDLGPATPLYEFTDTNAPGSPRRFYRLIWP